MRRFLTGAMACFLVVVHGVQAQKQQKAIQQYVSGINNVSFNEDQYNNTFAGNGFLIEHDGKVYAVTVKHSLLEAKTPTMQFVDVKEHVSEWQIHPNGEPDKAILLDELLNTDPNEKIDIGVLQKDWLLFSVKQAHPAFEALKLRKTPVQKGEQLRAIGCSYANKKSCQQDIYEGVFVEYDSNNLRVKLKNMDMSTLRGLSGSPVLDRHDQVVGIVSNVLPSRDGKGVDFAPASLDYLVEVLDRAINITK